MIRYDVSIEALEAKVLTDAKKYSEGGPGWSDVKVVYMREQGDSKCLYCERKLESVEIGLIEQDVEHFRPKSSVSSWPVPAHLQQIPITTPGKDGGYYRLPHELYNYGASCKPCNSTCKSDYFPISGTYDLSAGDPTELLTEKPLLIYPLGSWDDDPETLIGFNGLSPYAKNASGHGRHRALVTIAFFKLDDVQQRSNLFLERAQSIVALYQRLKDEGDPQLTANERKEAAEDVALSTSSKMPHANCLRSFVQLFKDDPAAAKTMYEDARRYRNSKS
jgi:hypothetical protein